MSTKHTPSPWRIEGSRGPGLIISAGVNPEGDGPNSYVGVLDPMFYVAGSESPFRADAALICAAPDLLEALWALAYPGEYAGQPSHEIRMANARAAIAKATGQ